MRREYIKLSYYGEYIDNYLFLPEKKGIYPVIVHLNGMPGFSPSEQEKRLAGIITQNNYALFTFDYPGVRKSTGTFSYYDAHAIIDKIITLLVDHKEINPSKIALLGESFGGAIAICYAARDGRIKVLGVRSPVYDTQYIVSLESFDTLAKIWTRNKQMKFPNKDLRELFKVQSLQFNPASLIDQLKIPICIVAGGKDEILKKDGFEKLSEKIPHDLSSEFYLFNDADHNFTKEEHFNEFKNKIIKFFKKHL